MTISNFAKKVILPILCIMAMAPLAHAAENNGTSTATVGFTEGALTLTDPSKTNTNFDFLTHELPFAIPADSTDTGKVYPYPSRDDIAAYKLVITDARSAHEEWTLTAQMTSYAHEDDESNRFKGIVLLGVGQKAFTYGTESDNMKIGQTLRLISEDNSALLVIRSGALSRDVYTVSWAHDQVSFRFAEDTNVSRLVKGNYQAIITWTIATEVSNEEG